MRTLFFIAYLIFGICSAQAAETLGHTLFDGKQIRLFADQTWEYIDQSDDSSPTCEKLSSRVQSCHFGSKFEKLPQKFPAQLAMYRYDERRYGAIIHEQIGSNDGMTPQNLRNAIVGNMEGGGVNPADIKHIADQSVMVGNREANATLYKVKVQGIDFIYSFVYWIESKDTFQIVSWKLGTDFNEEDEKIWREFSSLFKFD